ncbi:MAG TPA: helix-turn-helix transcriptional regulator [Ramlibacter sp.]|nr:helix-turn-helix transcriptional regulator [Ramlibacter sp.]
MAIRETVLANIEELMAVKGIPNYNVLAELSEIPQPTLSRFKSGIHGSISFENLEKLAQVFGVEPARLMARSPDAWADQKVAKVVLAMEKLPDWGKDAVVATSEAMLNTAGDGTNPGLPRDKL